MPHRHGPDCEHESPLYKGRFPAWDAECGNLAYKRPTSCTMIDKTGLKGLTGGPLVAAITTVCASSFLLFGYDQGVMSGVVISQYWLDEMGNPSTVMTGTITALYDVGAVFGAIIAAFTVERLGRKRSLLVGSSLIVIGSILMGASVERIQMMVGRIVTGLGRCSRKESKVSTN